MRRPRRRATQPHPRVADEMEPVESVGVSLPLDAFDLDAEAVVRRRLFPGIDLEILRDRSTRSPSASSNAPYAGSAGNWPPATAGGRWPARGLTLPDMLTALNTVRFAAFCDRGDKVRAVSRVCGNALRAPPHGVEPRRAPPRPSPRLRTDQLRSLYLQNSAMPCAEQARLATCAPDGATLTSRTAKPVLERGACSTSTATGAVDDVPDSSRTEEVRPGGRPCCRAEATSSQTSGSSARRASEDVADRANRG